MKMKAEVVAMTAEAIDEKTIARGGEILKKGGLVAFPTETVYGLGGNALDPKASCKIYAAKGRPSDNPLIVHIANIKDLAPIVKNIPEKAMILAKKFWPGPLTMIFEKSDLVPLETTGGLNSVAVRFPSDPIAAALILAAGGYVAAPSANTSGRPSPTTAQHVEEDLGDAIDMIIDGGPVGIGLESTIVDFTEEVPVVLRPGYISLEMLRETLGDVRMDKGLISPDSNIHPKAPGMKYRHYAPKAPVTVVTGDPAVTAQYIREHLPAGAGVICFSEFTGLFHGCSIHDLGPAADKPEQARRVFDALREFDHEAVSAIYAQCPDPAGLGLAVANRLKKAAGFHVIEL